MKNEDERKHVIPCVLGTIIVRFQLIAVVQGLRSVCVVYMHVSMIEYYAHACAGHK